MHDDQPPQALLSVRSPLPGPASLTWMPDGRFLACAPGDGVVSVWDVETGIRHGQVLGPPATCVALHAGADEVLHAAYEDGTVRRTSPLLRPGRPGSYQFRPITAAAWTPAGDRLALAHHGGFFEVHDADLYVRWTGQVASTVPLILAWHDDVAIVVAERATRSVAAFDTAGGILWEHCLAPEPAAMSIADGLLAIGCYNFAPLFVDLATGILT